MIKKAKQRKLFFGNCKCFFKKEKIVLFLEIVTIFVLCTIRTTLFLHNVAVCCLCADATLIRQC